MFTENGITFSKVILAAGRSDLRKGIDGLAAMVRLKYGLDPLEKGTLFLFCGVRRDRVKGLLWAGDRFIFLYIRLADGCFQWTRTTEEARSITAEEFKRLMEGFSIDPSVGPRRIAPVHNPKKGEKDSDGMELIHVLFCGKAKR